MPAHTRFSGVIVTVPGAGAKGHSTFKTQGNQVGVDIQIPTFQSANAFQISKPDGTVIFAIGPGGAAGGVAAPISADGALPATGGTFAITKAGSLAALTLLAPAADGISLVITSSTGFAHKITTAGLLRTGSAASNVATFAAFAGASLALLSSGGFWNVVSQNAITFS